MPKGRGKDVVVVADSDRGKSYDDIYDVLKSLVTIESPAIRKEITEDFTKAKLKEKDREFVVEMVANAFGVQSLFESMGKNAENMGFPKETVDGVEKAGSDQFQKMIIRVTMMANINRNLPNIAIRTSQVIPIFHYFPSFL